MRLYIRLLFEKSVFEYLNFMMSNSLIYKHDFYQKSAPPLESLELRVKFYPDKAFRVMKNLNTFTDALFAKYS